MITQELVKELFNYKDGSLYWKKATGKRIKVNDKAGMTSANNRRQIKVHGKMYYEHRLIFLMFHGHLPLCIDHIDNDRTNNCIENLREATFSNNQQNRSKTSKNKSGYKNVRWKEANKKWCVQLTINKKQTHIGYFDDLELANLAAQEARSKYHKEFAKG